MKNLKFKIKENKAITLIALVITIIVLVILAGFSLSLLLDKNGIIIKAITAKDEYQNSANEESKSLEELYAQLLLANSDSTTLQNIDMTTLKQVILDSTYPVGSIYITTDDKNPSETLGGTWEKYSKGRTLIGDGEDESGDDNGEKVSFTAGNKGGEYNHKLTIAEMPSHQHQLPFTANPINEGVQATGTAKSFNYIYGQGQTAATIGQKTEMYMTDGSSAAEGNETAYKTSFTGGNDNTSGIDKTLQTNSAQNNIQPYIVTYMWKRIK